MIPSLTFHHHGLALGHDRDALMFLATLGYNAGPLAHDPLQDVGLRLCTHTVLPAAEIVMPRNAPGPLANILKRNHELLYHTCYEVDDREHALGMLEAANIRLIEVFPPTSAVLFGGRRVSFHTAIGFGLIELLYMRL